jgi:hypothetical protein
LQAPQLLGSLLVSVHPNVQAAPVEQTHARFEQVSLGPHASPHAPQLLASDVRSAQVLPQVARLDGHWHTPLVQLPPLQEFPHVPQLLASDVRVAQVVPHAEVPLGHVWMQEPW